MSMSDAAYIQYDLLMQRELTLRKLLIEYRSGVARDVIQAEHEVAVSQIMMMAEKYGTSVEFWK